MDKMKRHAALIVPLMLAACGPSPTAPNGNDATTAPSPIPTPPAPAARVPSNAAAADNGGDPWTPELTPEAERGVAGARDVLLTFARAIELKDYERAWALLSPADKRKWSQPAFAAIFADLGKITVAVPDGALGGAAGSSFYTAPITITANDSRGRPVRYDGEAVLRRANDVDGATPEQRRWHFETLKLDWTH